MRRVVLVMLFIACLLAVLRLCGIFPRQTRIGQFALVYAYEANTHAQPDAVDRSGTGPLIPTDPSVDSRQRPVQFDGDRLYVARGVLPWAATQLCVISETSFAGITSHQGLVQTVRTAVKGRVGGGPAASLFDHAYTISVVDPGGSVRVALGDLAKVLSPGETWSVVARSQDGVIVLAEETSENAAMLEDLVVNGAQASRVTFCSYGVFNASAVGRPGR